MYSSARKLVRTPGQNPTSNAHQKSINKSIAKSQKSVNSKYDEQDDPIKIKQIMTSTTYNNVFNRLTNINNLKQFVKQSSVYFDFHQAQVIDLIPLENNGKQRFSFQIKTASIFEYLRRDIRFLKHYFALLIKQFPQKQEKLRKQIYTQYKKQVINKNKFELFFNPNQNKSNQMIQSTKRPNKSHQSFNKSLQKTQKSVNNKKEVSIKKFKQQISVEKVKFQQNSKRQQLKQNIKPLNKTKQNQYNSFENQKRNKMKKNIKPEEKSKEQIEKLKQINLDPTNKTKEKSKVSTLQNIKKIENTLNQIQQIALDSILLKRPIQIRNNSRNERFNEKDIHEKNKISKDQFITSDQNHKCEEASQRKVSKRTENAQEPKTSKKSNRQIIKFSEWIQVTHPQNRTSSQRKQEQKRQEKRRKTQKQCIDIIQKSFIDIRNEIIRPLTPQQIDKLSEKEREIVRLFHQINLIGNYKNFYIDRKFPINSYIGKFLGYQIEQVLSWPQDIDDIDEVYKTLVLTKSNNFSDEQQQGKSIDKFEFNQFEQTIKQLQINGITLVLINK